MTGGFYEQLGVDPAASAGQIRAAYGSAVARLVQRRRASVESGGDTRQIDLVRAQLDEAWGILSSPIRRRRYDAMLGWVRDPGMATGDGLWEHSSDALIHPAAAIAMKLLRMTTKLQNLANIKLAPSSSEHMPPTLVPHDEDLTSTGAKHLFSESTPPISAERAANVVELHATPVPSSGLRVVDGSPAASSVILLPAEAPRHRNLSSEEITRFVDVHGYTGALLRAAREAREIALQEMADKTRISVKYLDAIESDEFGVLPSATFVRGYVREMARMLKIDETSMVTGYMRRFPN
jgi:hypothetical protein